MLVLFHLALLGVDGLGGLLDDGQRLGQRVVVGVRRRRLLEQLVEEQRVATRNRS